MNLRLSGPDTENNKRLCWSRDLTENLQNPHGTKPNRTPTDPNRTQQNPPGNPTAQTNPRNPLLLPLEQTALNPSHQPTHPALETA